MVLADDELVPNVRSTPVYVEFETSPDSTPPQFIAGYPLLVAVDDSSVGVQARLDEVGSFAFAVTAPDAPIPSALEVFAGTDGVGTAAVAHGVAEATTVGVTAVAAIQGLLASTSYTV